MNKQLSENVNKNYSNNMDDTNLTDIQEYRSNICRSLLISFSLMAIPALLASLSRIPDIGFQPVMILHIIIATLLWLTAIFQSKIPYNFKASFIVVIFYFIGLAGIYQFGLIAGGVAFFVVAGPVATLLFNGTKGLYILAIGLGSVVILGLLTLSGNIKYSYDIATYAVASSSWITSIFSWVLTSTVLSVALYTFNKNMISALHLSHDNQKALRLSEEKLKIAIQEKEQSLRTLEAAFNEIKTLKGIIPICSYCHNIRDDKGAWDKMESYLSKHSDAEFSHGICPKCLVKARADAGFE